MNQKYIDMHFGPIVCKLQIANKHTNTNLHANHSTAKDEKKNTQKPEQPRINTF